MMCPVFAGAGLKVRRAVGVSAGKICCSKVCARGYWISQQGCGQSLRKRDSELRRSHAILCVTGVVCGSRAVVKEWRRKRRSREAIIQLENDTVNCAGAMPVFR